MLTLYLRSAVVIALVFGQGCASYSSEHTEDYRRISFAVPEHYEVWLVDVLMEKSGERSWRQPGGTVKCCWRGPKGPAGPGAQADPFPEMVWVHWFSFAEQRYYAHLITLPESIESKMRNPGRVITNEDVRQVPRHNMTIGLAPGGQIVVWVQSQIGNEMEVLRFQAEPVDGDPSDFSSLTEAYLQKHGDYLEEHGLQLGKW